MANDLYPTARAAFLAGDLAWDTDSVKVVAVDSGYTYSVNHEFLDDVTAGLRVATTASGMTSMTTTSGYADADNATLASVTGDIITGLIVYQSGASEAASRLIAYYDTRANSTSVTVTPDGNDIVIQWSSSGLFRL